MRVFLVLMKKEILELIRTYRIMVTFLVCLALGFSCPIFAKLTPDLLKHYSGMSIQITITEPTAIDAWNQYFKDCPLMCLFAVILCVADSVPKEIRSGSIINILTKGVSRTQIYFSKYFTAVINMIVSIVVCFLTCALYTKVIFQDKYSVNQWVALWGPLCCGLLFITITFLFETFMKNSIYIIGITGLCYIVFLTINIFDKISKYNPVGLVQNNSHLAGITGVPDYFAVQMLTCLIISLILNLFAVISLKKTNI